MDRTPQGKKRPDELFLERVQQQPIRTGNKTDNEWKNQLATESSYYDQEHKEQSKDTQRKGFSEARDIHKDNFLTRQLNYQQTH